MWQRYFMLGILALLIVMWNFIPKVTEKDSVSYAYALFLDYCTAHNINPHQYDQESTMSVEGGKTDLIFIHRFHSDNMDTVVVRINRDGETEVSTEPLNQRA